MKEVYNAAWYAAQEITPWPFLYSPISDKNLLLPDSIISDIKLITRGTRPVFITGVQVTSTFVSVVLSSESGIVAACTIPQPVKPYRHYKLEIFDESTVGIIVFGHGACTEYGSWQFSEHNQLNPTTVVSLPGFPVLSIGKSTKISGDVTLEAGSDLILEKVEISLGHTLSEGNEENTDTINGVGYKLSLSPNATLRSTTVTTLSELLKEYAGPCSMRLTNKDCPYITSINGVSPDTDGNINIKTDDSDKELTSITVAVNGSYSYSVENNCKSDPKETVLVLIGDKEEIEIPYIGGTFRRCGLKYCEIANDDNHQEDFDNAIIVNDGVTTGVRVNQITGLLEPINGIRGRAAVKFTESPKDYVEAVFPYYYYISAGSPRFAIIYNIHWESDFEVYDALLFEKNSLSLGETREVIDIHYNHSVKLTLSYKDGIFTGVIAVRDSAGNVLDSRTVTCSGENTGGMGIYIEHCRCQSWSAV